MPTSVRFCAVLCLFLFLFLSVARAAQNCSTALGTIAQSAIDTAINKMKDSACSGLKSGPIGIDKTKALELRSFSLCEEGLLVTASIAVYVKCGNSDAATVNVNIDDEINATAKVDLEACKVLEASVKANTFLGKIGMSAANANQKLSEEAARTIGPYCKK